MILKTIGHATLLLLDDSGAPLLATDPWLLGSCYWRSWWLQHYPDAAEIDALRGLRYCFITHEHADHFHPPSIRRLGKGPLYLAPALPEEKISPYLHAGGFRAETVPAGIWRALAPGVRLLSLPAANDDSILLVDTPSAVIINFNDNKPGRGYRAALRRHLDAHVPGKTRILLSSYSPASLVNSFFRDGTRLNLRVKSGYVRAACAACDELGADCFMPFASQAVFRRTDSEWANAFKVSFADLEGGWTSKARLLPPYASIDLSADPASAAVARVRPEDYRRPPEDASSKIAAQQALDAVPLAAADFRLLEQKLSRAAPFLALLFPRGLAFHTGNPDSRPVFYDPWTLRAKGSGRRGSVAFHIPAAVLRDILATGRFGDLGITMSVRVDLNGWNPWLAARLVYVLFFWITLHDYGHTTSLGAFGRWIRAAWRFRRPRFGEA